MDVAIDNISMGLRDAQSEMVIHPLSPKTRKDLSTYEFICQRSIEVAESNFHCLRCAAVGFTYAVDLHIQ